MLYLFARWLRLNSSVIVELYLPSLFHTSNSYNLHQLLFQSFLSPPNCSSFCVCLSNSFWTEPVEMLMATLPPLQALSWCQCSALAIAACHKCMVRKVSGGWFKCYTLFQRNVTKSPAVLSHPQWCFHGCAFLSTAALSSPLPEGCLSRRCSTSRFTEGQWPQKLQWSRGCLGISCGY